MITKEQYESAINLIEKYKNQCNKELIGLDTVNRDQFQKIIPLKDNSQVTVGDIIFLSKQDGDSYMNSSYDKIVCTGYCGKDEFFGRKWDGLPVSWLDSDVFKVIGFERSIPEIY